MDWVDTSGYYSYTIEVPYRITPLVTDNYYHIFNRGVAHQPTFLLARDYERFLLYLSYYRHKEAPVRLSKLLQIPVDTRKKILDGLETINDSIVDIIAYCCMPNHFHILLKQRIDGGVSLFMKKVTDGYTRYYNTKHQRVGPLFQGAFKAVHISSNEQLLHVSRYIHLNPLVSAVVRDNDFLTFPWSSLQSYINDKSSPFVNPQPILENFRNSQKYLEFIKDQIDYGKRLEEIKHLTFE